MAISIDYAIGCEPLEGFALVPLPAKKTLWEAEDADKWSKEFEDVVGKKELFGLTKKGGLVKLFQRSSGIKTVEARWEEWYADADGFAPAVMLAAQLL